MSDPASDIIFSGSVSKLYGTYFVPMIFNEPLKRYRPPCSKSTKGGCSPQNNSSLRVKG